MMKKPVVVVGMGEIGELFAQGFLKIGHPVFPVLRHMNPATVATRVEEPEMVILAVGENDLYPLLESVPDTWRGRLVLLQNELLPRDWLRHGLADPTVIVVWFDKKKGRPFVNVLPTPVCGSKASLIVRALESLEVPCREISRDELLYELVRKNLYILTINIAGIRLHPGSTVSELWDRHRGLAEEVAAEILDIQEWLTETPLPRKRLMDGMLEGFAGDPNHICRGRTAPERLERMLDAARRGGIQAPTLQGIAGELNRR